MPTPSNPSSRSQTPIQNPNPNIDPSSIPSHIQQDIQPPSRSSSLRANQRSDRLKEKSMASIERSGSDGGKSRVVRGNEGRLETTGTPIPGPKQTSGESTFESQSKWSLRPDGTDDDPSTFATPPETPDPAQPGRTSASASASEDSHESGSKWEVEAGMGKGMTKGKGKGKEMEMEGVRVAKRVEVRTEVGVLSTFGEGGKALKPFTNRLSSQEQVAINLNNNDIDVSSVHSHAPFSNNLIDLPANTTPGSTIIAPVPQPARSGLLHGRSHSKNKSLADMAAPPPKNPNDSKIQRTLGTGGDQANYWLGLERKESKQGTPEPFAPASGVGKERQREGSHGSGEEEDGLSRTSTLIDGRNSMEPLVKTKGSNITFPGGMPVVPERSSSRADRSRQQSSSGSGSGPDMDPWEKAVLVKRNKKLEQVLGETLKESEIGRKVVKPTQSRAARERSPVPPPLDLGLGSTDFGLTEDGEEEDGEYLCSPRSPFVEEPMTRSRGRTDEDEVERSTPSPALRTRTESDPSLPSPVMDGFDRSAPRKRERPRSSIDFFGNRGGTSISGSLSSGEAASLDQPNWLKRMSTKFGGSGSSVVTLGAHGSGGIMPTIKGRPLDESIRHGVRVLVKQEKVISLDSTEEIAFRYGMDSPAPIPAIQKKEKAIKRLSLPTGGILRRGLSLPSSPDDQGKKGIFWAGGKDLVYEPASPVKSPVLSEREKRIRRQQLNKLNRLLGTRVPLDMLLAQQRNAEFSPATEVANAVKAQEIASENLSAEEKRRAVKVATKMSSFFGEVPPVEVMMPTPRNSDENSPRSPIEDYRFSLSSIRYLMENDRASLNEILQDMEVHASRSSMEADDETLAPSPMELELPKILQSSEADSPRRRRRSKSSPAPRSPQYEGGPSGILPGSPTRNPQVIDLSDEPVPSQANTSGIPFEGFDDFLTRRKKAGKLSKLLGDPRIAVEHLSTVSPRPSLDPKGGVRVSTDNEALSVGDTDSAALRKVKLLERVLEEIEVARRMT